MTYAQCLCDVVLLIASSDLEDEIMECESPTVYTTHTALPTKADTVHSDAVRMITFNCSRVSLKLLSAGAAEQSSSKTYRVCASHSQSPC